MRIGFYAGSFDPFTNGHLNVITKAAQLFDQVIVGIGVHPQKIRRFDKDTMQEAIKQVLIRENLMNVKVISYDQLSVDVALDYHSTFLVRGIRNGMDYEYEENMASISQLLRLVKVGACSSLKVVQTLDENSYLVEYKI